MTYDFDRELQLLKLRSLGQEEKKKSFGRCLFCSTNLTVSNIRFIRNPVDGRFVQSCIDDAKTIQTPVECPKCFVSLPSQDKILEHMSEHYGNPSSHLPGYYSVRDYPTNGRDYANTLKVSPLSKNDFRQLLYHTYGVA